MEQHRAQNRVESLHKTHLLVVAHAQFISREVTKKIIEATEFKVGSFSLWPFWVDLQGSRVLCISHIWGVRLHSR